MCRLKQSRVKYNQQRCLLSHLVHNILHALLFRPARCNDLCTVHQGHCNICSSDDVFHHSARGLLHCMDLWGWYDSDAVLPAHTVCLCFLCKVQTGFAVSICFNSGEVSQISLMLVYKYFDFMMPVFNSSNYPVRQVFERLLSVLKNVRCSVLSFFNKQISCW